jgi:catechol 2,3-dioxygenase-like lactoylglutathione lyase family enzyme
MLLDGFNHVAVLTNDSERFHAFYSEVFEAVVIMDREEAPGVRLSVVNIGHMAEFNVFQIDHNYEVERQTPMFGRGRLDHMALRVPNLQAFSEIRERLIARGAADEFVTDFGPYLSIFFRDPDGLEGEVVVANPEAQPGVYNKPGTPAARFASSRKDDATTLGEN